MPALSIAARARRAAARGSSRCSSAPSAGSRRGCCRRATSATICCRPSRSTAAPGGRTSDGRSSPGELLRRIEQLFAEERPVAVLGTGGYASAPVVWWATRRGSADRRAGAERLSRARHPAAQPAGAATSTSACPRRAGCCGSGANTRVFDTGNPITPPRPSDGPRRFALFGLDGTQAGPARDRRKPGRAGDQPGGGRVARRGWRGTGSTSSG